MDVESDHGEGPSGRVLGEVHEDTGPPGGGGTEGQTH